MRIESLFCCGTEGHVKHFDDYRPSEDAQKGTPRNIKTASNVIPSWQGPYRVEYLYDCTRKSISLYTLGTALPHL